MLGTVERYLSYTYGAVTYSIDMFGETVGEISTSPANLGQQAVIDVDNTGIYLYDTTARLVMSVNKEGDGTKYLSDDGTYKTIDIPDVDLTGYATESYVTTAISGKADKATTLAGYGITDAKISNGVITLGSSSITPLTGVTSSMITTALGYTPYNAANFTRANIKSTLGISDWALASAKPSYAFSEITDTPTTLSGYGITDAQRAVYLYGGASTDYADTTVNPNILAYQSSSDKSKFWFYDTKYYQEQSETANRTQIAWGYLDYGMKQRYYADSAWSNWVTFLHSGNYNSYAPTLTGTGASGTWGISITGNAATATKATQDGSGNVIVNTYATKSELNNTLTEANLYTDDVIETLVGTAPETLDTIHELATAVSENQEIIDNIESAITNKVDKVSGKGLSTNDYTTAEKNKLAGIASGAEVNVQSDWSVTDSTSDAYIKNKPTIPTVPSSLKNPYSLTIQKNGTTVTNGTYDGSAAKTVNITVPTKVSELTNDSGYKTTDTNTTYTFASGTNSFKVTPSGGSAQTVTVTPSIAAASTSAAGLMSAADKTKLNGIATGATANTGTVTSVATGVGLTGGTISTSGTVKAKLRSETALTVDSAAATTTSGRVYPVAVDKTGYLAVNVPWTDTNTTYTDADILAKLKNVDGSGSGLDADTLDGVDNGELTARLVNGTYTKSGGEQYPSYVPSGKVRWNMMRITSDYFNVDPSDTYTYCDWMMMDNYTGSDVPYVTMIGV